MNEVVQAGGFYFEILENYRDALDVEVLDARYSEVLDKYPIIVGDIGYEKLRLKGFYESKYKKADISRRFSSIHDYLLEYCNFGCPYFVLRRLTTNETKRFIQIDEVTDASYIEARATKHDEVQFNEIKEVQEESVQIDSQAFEETHNIVKPLIQPGKTFQHYK